MTEAYSTFIANRQGKVNMAEEDVSESAEVGVKEHFDNAVVMLILIALFVYAFGAVGRAIAKKTNKPGINTFFGGNS
jgi:hypothetical protein